MFRKYNSIENTYRNEFIEKIKDSGFSEYEYVVQEKVHGANMSFYTKDGEHFAAAKRTGELLDGERFYNYEMVLDSIEPNLTLLWKMIKRDYPDMEQITVFGELFGGYYNHPKVAVDRAAIRTQKGIFYSPSNHFYAFDILLNLSEYVDVDRANEYFKKANLIFAETIFRGSLQQCLEYPNDFESIIYKKFDLPKVDGNVIEGVVIKPVVPAFFNSGGRVILKNKNEKWAEKIKRTRKTKPAEKPSDIVLELQEIIMTYVTDNRMDNVISKIGEITMKDFGKIMGMFNKDVVEDFTKDNHQALDELDKKEIKIINKSFSDKSRQLVKNRLMR